MKRVLAAAVVVIISVGLARGESSLSALGYGLFNQSAGARAAGMGLVSLSVRDTLGLNLMAPALWSGPSSVRFGFSGNVDQTVTNDRVYGEDASDEAGLYGVAFALPVTDDWFLGIAMNPYTRSNFRWQGTGSADWHETSVLSIGAGGISQSSLAIAFPAGKAGRLGLSLRAVFGEIKREWSIDFPGVEARSTGLESYDRFSGIGWGLSWSWFGSFGWSSGANIIGPVTAGIQQQKIIRRSRIIQEDVKTDLDDGYDLPWDVSVGVGKLVSRHFLGFETAWQGWGNIDHTSSYLGDFKDAFRYSLGWEWSPEFKSFDPFWKALIYRGGVYVQDHYVAGEKGHQPKRIALTGGFSIPYFKQRSRIDVALEYGWMGDRSLDDVSEKSLLFTIGFNHSQQWFVNRRERR